MSDSEDVSTSWLAPVLTLAGKDLRRLGRDPLALAWVFGFPLAFALLFGALRAGGGGPLPLAVVDADATPEASALVQHLAASPGLRLVLVEGNPEEARETARDTVRRGEAVGWLHIRPGFGGVVAPLDPGLGFLSLEVDPSRTAERQALTGQVARAAFDRLRAGWEDRRTLERRLKTGRALAPVAPGLAEEERRRLSALLNALEGADPDWLFGAGRRELAVGPLAGGELRPRSPFEVSFPAAILWGLLLTAATFATSLVGERRGGTYLRLRLAPLSRGQILAGTGLACSVVSLAVVVLLAVVGGWGFGVRVEAPGLLALATVSAIVAFVGLMLLVSVLGRTVPAVNAAAWALFLAMAMVGGGMLPLVAMPEWMQAVSRWSPVQWGILAFEGAVWRGFDWVQMLPPCGALVALGLTSFALGRWRLRQLDTRVSG